MPRDAIDPDVQTSVLPNGLRVTTVALPHLHTSTVAAFVKVGARFEAPGDNGLSHFVEHMMFRGTKRHRDSLALNTAIERLGGTLHAETGRDYTLLQSSFEPALVGAGLAIYGELFAHPRFGDIELERALILEEINEDYDESDVEINADDIARGLMFEGHALGQRIIGPRANVERFDGKDVRRHFARFYGAKNAIVCVAGPVEHAAIVALAREHLAGWPSGEPAHADPAPPYEGGPRWKHVADSGSQTNLSLLLRGIPELDPAYMSFVALLRCLDDGMSTRLHYQLCDQKGLAYSINAGIEPLADAGLLEVTGATANAKLPQLVGEVLAILGGLRDGVAEADLAKARTRYRHELMASLDDPSAMAGWFGGAALYYAPPTLAQRLAQMAAVTRADVAAAARRVIQRDNLALAVVGALSRARQGELRQVVRDWA